jgi:hypothetical protein
MDDALSPWQDLADEPRPRDHVVQLYHDLHALVEAVSLFTIAALARRDAVLLVATREHAEAFLRAVAAQGYRAEALMHAGQLTVLEAEKVMARFMVDGRPDRGRFEAVVRELVERTRLRSPFRALVVYGEIVDLLWADNLPAAVRLEELWNDALREHNFALLCAYCLERAPAGQEFPPDLREAHTHVIEAPAPA